jgi:hypothetical protein
LEHARSIPITEGVESMSAEAILLEHSIGDGFLDVVIGGRRSCLSETTRRLRGDLVAAAIGLLPRNAPERVIFLVVDDFVGRGEYDRFVRLLQNGQRPPLPLGFDFVCGDARLVDYVSD